MTDNEKLIEEAAGTIAVAELLWRGGTWGDLQDHQREEYRRVAREVLAVFEKLYTPTDDEREALARAQWDDPVNVITWDELTEMAENGDGDYHETRDYALAAAGRGVAAGFRRSAVPEPSGSERDRLTLIARDVHMYDGGENAAITGPHARRIADAILARHIPAPTPSAELWRCGKCGDTAHAHSLATSTCIWDPIDSNPVPQGEPSDAQVDAACAEIAARMNYKVQPTRGTMRAALRAAGVVGQEGEKR